MSAGFSICVIALVGVLAWVAQLKHKRVLAVALVVLVGVLAGNAPGPVGDWSETVAAWLYDLPVTISQILDGR
jgi:hypothetical protein